MGVGVGVGLGAGAGAGAGEKVVLLHLPATSVFLCMLVWFGVLGLSILPYLLTVF